jgi:outer membrane protein OmpA-like peptidoglycan-associated protein
MNSWYLRKPNGKEFGPESIETLRHWAEQSRILAGNELSQDRKNWQFVEDVIELNMCHIAILPNKSYGPFNIHATKDLLLHNVLSKDIVIVNNRTGDEIIVADYLKKNRRKIKKRASKKNTGQSDFNLLSSPARELKKILVSAEQDNSTKQTTKDKKKRVSNYKMDSDKQEFLFDDDDDFKDQLEYVVDEDAQIEMPFEEESTIIYDNDDFPTPNNSSTVFMSKDTERFPKLVTKRTILSIDDVQPVEDKRQVKLFEHKDNIVEETSEDEIQQEGKNEIEQENLDKRIIENEPAKAVEKNSEDEIQQEEQNEFKQEISEEETIEFEPTKAVEQTSEDKSQQEEQNELTQEKLEEKAVETEPIKTIEETTEKKTRNQAELVELKNGLEITTKLFIEQQDKDKKTIQELTAERNKLEIEISNSNDALKELRKINVDQELNLDKNETLFKEKNEILKSKEEIIANFDTEHSKSLNLLDVQSVKVEELIESSKDLTLVLAAERDKNQKQEALTKQYQQELDDAEKKHNKIVASFEEKESELLEEKAALEASKENIFNNHKNLEQKIKDMDIDKIEIEKNLENKLISIRQELKAEEESKEALQKDVKELQSKIKSTDTIVNERMRSINEQATRVSTKYKQECRTTERLDATNKKLMITIASLILLLLVFIVYIIVSNLPSSRKPQPQQIETVQKSKPPTQLTNIKPLNRADISFVGAKTINDGTLVRVVFDEAMFSKLSSPSAFAVKNIRANLENYKEYLNDYDIVIEGHTDNSPLNNNPQYKDNQALGLARAISFKKLLVVSFGLPEEGISTVSAGSNNPPFNNSTPSGKEKNKTIVLYLKTKTTHN